MEYVMNMWFAVSSPFPAHFWRILCSLLHPLFCIFCCLFAVINCTDPGHLENSIRQVQPSGPHRFSFGTTVSYQCSHGYYLLGTHVLTCQGDGTWDRALPQCLCKFSRIIPVLSGRWFLLHKPTMGFPPVQFSCCLSWMVMSKVWIQSPL